MFPRRSLGFVQHRSNRYPPAASRSIQVERPGAITLRALVVAAHCADLWGANYQSSGDRRLEQTSTVPCPVISGEVGTRRRRPAGTFCGRSAE